MKPGTIISEKELVELNYTPVTCFGINNKVFARCFERILWEKETETVRFSYVSKNYFSKEGVKNDL